MKIPFSTAAVANSCIIKDRLIKEGEREKEGIGKFKLISATINEIVSFVIQR